MSTRTYQFSCQLPRIQADALNAESARIYNAVMVEHWRIYGKKGVWIRPFTAEKLNDRYDVDTPKCLHAHSIDAAQAAFYKACKQVHTKRAQGDKDVRFPHRRRRFRTTIWKKTGVHAVENNVMYLSLARGYKRLSVNLPLHLDGMEKQHILEVRLVFNKATFRYSWHVVVEDGVQPVPSESQAVAGVDLGEIHPAAITDGVEACVVSCREMRALHQGRNKRIASIDAKLATYQKGSRRWQKLKSRKRRFLAQCNQKQRDMEHKIARSIVDWAQEQSIGMLVIGDVRDIADGKRLNKKSQQKIANWSHGTIRKYIKYKAAEVGIQVNDNVHERYTSQTCIACGNRHKPRGRIFTCPSCGSAFHRDVVGAANIASRYVFGKLGEYSAPKPKYRYPIDVWGKRSPVGTREMARFGENR